MQVRSYPFLLEIGYTIVNSHTVCKYFCTHVRGGQGEFGCEWIVNGGARMAAWLVQRIHNTFKCETFWRCASIGSLPHLGIKVNH